MALQTMYPGQPNSPQTELASAIDDEQTTIPLLDTSVLPDPPNICTIGTGEDAETVLYEGIDGNDLTGVTRGFQGTARAWPQGTKVARNFTAYDYDALRQNVADHVAATTGVHGATSTATPNTIVQRDAQGRIKAAAPAASDDVARKAEVDGKVSKSGDTMTGKLISAGSSGSIANSEPDKGMIEVRSASDTDAAFMTFHRVGVYASYIGIDVDNKWKVGGWSAGSSAREIWHAGNVPIETGTWTPIITSTSGSNNHTYGSRSGRYVRMGDLVFVWGNVSLTAKDPGMAGTVVIGGLPFLVANDGHYPAVNIGWYGYVAKGNPNQLTARFDPNSPIVSLWEGGDNLGPVALAASKITDTTEFAIGGVYKTNV